MMRKIGLSAMEIERKLKTHLVLAGSPGGGKSLACQKNAKGLIPGTWSETSKSTACALTTEVNFDGYVIFMDELPDEFFTPDGDAMLKEVIANGTLTTRMAQVIDTKRKQLLTKSKHSNVYLGWVDSVAPTDAPAATPTAWTCPSPCATASPSTR